MILAEGHAFGADGARCIKRLPGVPILYQFNRANESDTARFADQRMLAEFVQQGLELRRQLAHVLVQPALLVDFECPQRNGCGNRVAGVRKAMTEETSLAARFDHRLVQEFRHDHGTDRQVRR